MRGFGEATADRTNRITRLSFIHSPGAVVVSLAFEPLALTIHIAVGLVSGFWAKIRWHAITGVVLAILPLVHTVRRRSRLRRSKVR